MSLVGISGMLMPTAFAQVNNSNRACYLQSTEGIEYDLSALCGGFEPEAQEVVLQTGDVQVTLRWDTADDLDLYVTGPSGEQVSYFNPAISSGGQLDVDANMGCMERMASPVENIFWPTGGGVPGEYMITVDLFDRCTQSSEPINFTIDLLVKGQTSSRTGSVSDGQTSVDFPFSYSEVSEVSEVSEETAGDS